MKTLLGFVLAMSVTMVMIPLLMRWAVALGVQDIPEARKVHTVPVPRVGGIAMACGVLLALFIWGATSRPMQAFWVGIAVLVGFGFWDDRKTLPAGPKFAGQAIAVLIAMLWGDIALTTMTFADRVPLPALIGLPLSFLFLVGGTNAFNLADGLDGLAGGMAMLCLSGTALLAYTVSNAAVGTAAIVIVGALVGFLRFNTHPARVFMGDCGSQVLGFSAAALTLLLTQDPQSPLSSALPLLLLGMPIIDTLLVMIERLSEGRSPFTADRRHIHHRLLALGFEHGEAVSILYVLQGALLVAAWYLRYASDLSVLAVFGVASALIVIPIRVAQHFGLRVRTPTGAGRLSNQNVTGASKPAATFSPRVAGVVLAGGLSAYGFWVLAMGGSMSRDELWLALGLALVLVAGMLVRRRSTESNWLDRAALYPTGTLAILLSKSGSAEPLAPLAARYPILQSFDWVLFPILALAMIVCIRGTGERTFKITPLDLLVLLIAITLPNLAESVASTRAIGLTILELVLLLYCLETLSFAARSHWRWLSAGAAVFLVSLSIRSLL
jgi:UDP-GlcNAc:undecaprenyl-phosphate GlcNAc-1-phosphate transferase